MRLCWAWGGSYSRCGRGTRDYRHINVVMRLSRGIITANVTRKSLGIPDSAGAVRNNQVRYWTACNVNNIFLDRNCASCSGCETPNFLRCALCKPDRSSCILRDTRVQASSCCNSSLDKGFGCGIEEANFVCRVFGKPDIAIVIEDQIVRVSAGRGYLPLLPGRSSCFICRYRTGKRWYNSVRRHILDLRPRHDYFYQKPQPMEWLSWASRLLRRRVLQLNLKLSRRVQCFPK